MRAKREGAGVERKGKGRLVPGSLKLPVHKEVDRSYPAQAVFGGNLDRCHSGQPIAFHRMDEFHGG